MQCGSKRNNQQGFSILELMVALMVMGVVFGAVFGLMRDSLKFTTATYELTDAQENLRTAQEFINRDLLNAGDGLRSYSTIQLPTTFVTNYLTLTPIADPIRAGIADLGIVTSDNQVPAGTAVLGAVPATTVRSSPLLTDRQTILQIDPDPTNTAITPSVVNSSGTALTVTSTQANRFSAGDVCFVGVAPNATFATITSITGTGATRNLNFATGDTYGLNLAGAANNIKVLSNSGVDAVSLFRVRMIHYYINANGLLMRRVFGLKGSGFLESPIAEHVVNVQFTYSLVMVDDSVDPPTVTPSISAVLTTSEQQLAVRQVEVKITVETPHNMQNNSRQQLSMTTSTSVRNMQFREALMP